MLGSIARDDPESRDNKREEDPVSNANLRTLATIAATDNGRGTSRLAAPTIDDLGRAAAMLVAGAPNLRVGILTGFFIPRAQAPAAETDGPLGAVQLAAMIAALGGTATLITDSHCAPVLEGFLDGLALAGVRSRPHLLVADTPDAIDLDLTHVISIERPGHSADGSYRNMFGTDISAYCPPLDEWFAGLDIPKIAIGDGGNEVGMGRLDPALIASIVERGHLIASVVPADCLIVSGTSNWGGHALCAAVAALGALDPDHELLSEPWCRRVLAAGVDAGAVDGVSSEPTPSVDGLSWASYWAVPRTLNELAGRIGDQPDD
jgi:hypothetical protein